MESRLPSVSVENPGSHSRKYFIETVDVMVTGTARPMVQDMVAGDTVAEFSFEKAFFSMLSKKYNENLAKFQGHPIPGERKKDKRKGSGSDNILREGTTGTNLKASQTLSRSGEHQFWTRTFASEEFLLNMNFHFVGTSVFDPYINEHMASGVQLTIYAFNSADESEFRKAIALLGTVHKDSLNSRLKFQALKSTTNTFQSEFYDNVIVALTEIPALEQSGPVLLLGFYDEEDPGVQQLTTLEKKAEEMMTSQGFEHAKYIKVTKKTLEKSVADAFCWVLRTFLKLKDAKFELLENQDKLQKQVVEQLVNNKQPGWSQPGGKTCTLI